MKRLALPALVLVMLFLAMLPARASPDVYTDDSFDSSQISFSGTKRVDGNVQLLIVPENWRQTTKSDFDQWVDNENVTVVDPGNVRLAAVAGDNWTWVRNTVTGALGEAAVGTGENIYIAKGTSFYRYRPVDDSWTTLTAPTNPDPSDTFKTGTALAWDNGDYIYALFGAATADSRRWFYRYSISGNSWEALENTPADQGEGDAIAWVGLDNCLYATIGGEQRPTYFARYDPTTDTWDDAAVADPPAGMGDGAALVWTGDNYLYALRGEYYESSPLYTFWRYDLATDIWNRMADIPATPHGAKDGVSGVGGVGDGGSLLYIGLWLPNHADYIYALSGNQAAPEPIPDNRFYRYTISTNNWERLADLPFGIGNYVGCRLAYAGEHIHAWQGASSTWAGGGDDLVKYEFPTYLENGYFISSVFDAGVDSVWQTISWDESSAELEWLNKKRFVGAEPENLIDNKSKLGVLPPIQVLLNPSFESGDPPSNWSKVRLSGYPTTPELNDVFNQQSTSPTGKLSPADGNYMGHTYLGSATANAQISVAAEQTSSTFGTVTDNNNPVLEYYADYDSRTGYSAGHHNWAGGVIEVEFTSGGLTYRLRYFYKFESDYSNPTDNDDTKYIICSTNWYSGTPGDNYQNWTENSHNLNSDINTKWSGSISSYTVDAIRVGIIDNRENSTTTSRFRVCWDNVRLISENPREGYVNVQHKDGVYENISEENASEPTYTYTYVSSSSAIKGSVTNFANQQDNDGNYATLAEGQVGGTNLVLNPGFETGDFTNWTKVGTAGSIIISSTYQNTGTYSVNFVNLTTAYTGRGIRSDPVSADSGQKYTFGAWLYLPSVAGATVDNYNFRIRILWYDALDANIENYPGTTGWSLSAFDTWQQKQWTGVVAPAGAVKASLLIEGKRNATAVPLDNVYIDDTYITRDITYDMEIYENIADIPGADTYAVQLRYQLDNANENFRVQVLGPDNVTWENFTTLLTYGTGAWTTWENAISPDKVVENTVRLRFVDMNPEGTSTALLRIDYLRVKCTTSPPPEYALRWEHRITGVENTYENAMLKIRGKTCGDNENIIVAIWDNFNSKWENIGNLTTTEKDIIFAIDNISKYLRDDNISIKFQDADNADATQTTILIDYVVLEAQKPYSTSLRVWTSTSSDNSTWSGWLENASGDSLPYENRYIRYRVQLSTTDGEVSPVLYEMRIAYVTKTPRSGTFTGQPLELGYVDSWGTLGWDAALPENTSISFATRSSPDGSIWSGWSELGSSAILSPIYNRPYLQVRVTLYGLGITSPTLYSYSISYTPDRTPPTITLSEPSDGFTTSGSYITVRGEISDMNPFTLEVNGQAVYAPGSFSTQVLLSPGVNTIRLTARDVAGNQRTLTISGTQVILSPPVTPSGPSAEQVAVVAAVAAAGVAALAAWVFLRPPVHHSSGSFGRRHR